MSRQIQQFEETIPAVLLERNSKRVTLTEAGKSFYEHGLKILAQLQHAVDESRILSLGQKGNLSVEIFGSAILDLILQLLHRFSTIYPNVNVPLHPMYKDAQIQALRERRLTIGFNRLVPAEPDIEQERVQTEPLIIAIPATHSQAKRKEVELGDVLYEPLILYPRDVRDSFMVQVRKLYSEYGAVPVVSHEVTDVTTSIALVATWGGLRIVSNAAKNLRLPAVVYRPLKCRGNSSIELICLYGKGDKSPVLQAFLQTVRAFISEAHSRL